SDRVPLHASENRAAISSLALSAPACCLLDNYDLDDVLSAALAYRGVARWLGKSAPWFASLLLRGKTPPTGMKGNRNIGLRPVRPAGLKPAGRYTANTMSAGHPGRMPMFRRNSCAAFIFMMGLVSTLSAYAQQNPAIAPRAMPVAAGPNDVARFLAGMPVAPDSPLASLAREPAWQQHAAFFEEQFAKLPARQRQKLHAWQETNLPESLQPIPVAFYMFSGPDFLYVDQFFPRAAVYVLCGKEAMGPPPDPSRIANLSGALGNLENAMKSSLNTTYFITKDMKIDLHEQNLNGVLPILYTFIARADKSITNVTFGALNSSGAFE